MLVPVDLSKLSDVVKNDVAKKDVYDKLVTKVNNIDTSGFVLKTNYDADKSELENKIPDTSGLVKKTDYNTKITDIKGKIPDISNLATKTALITVENKIPNVCSLVKKTDYNTRVAEIDTKVSNFNGKIAKTESIIKKLKGPTGEFLLYFLGSMMFDGGDGFQAYLMFQPVYRYFKMVTNTNYISSWKSKGLSGERIKPPTTSDNSLNPIINYYDYNIRVKFTASCLKQSKITYTHKKIVNIYVVDELSVSNSNGNDPTLKNCLFGVVTLTKNVDIDKYGHSGYGIGFDRRSSVSFPGGGFGQNVLIFGADMSSSAHIDNKKKDILVIGKEPTQGLEHTLTTKKMYSINFTVTKKKLCLS